MTAAPRTQFRPFSNNGRWTIAAIMLVFAAYSGLSLLLSERTTTGSEHKASVLEVAARQRTLAERYAKEVLLSMAGAPSASRPIADDLKQSAAALLDGGVAPGVAGDDDEYRLAPLRGSIVRNQLRQGQRLINDLIATGNGLLAGRTTLVRLTAHEHLPPGASPLTRLTILTALTSNVSLNVARSIANRSDKNVSKVVFIERLLAGLGLAIFGMLSWALVVSTRRRSAHFRSVVASTTGLVLVFSGEQCRYASNSVLRMTAATEASLLGEGIVAYVHQDDQTALREVLRTGTPATVEFRLRDAERGWRSLEAKVSDLREDRHVRGIVLNARDVTER